MKLTLLKKINDCFFTAERKCAKSKDFETIGFCTKQEANIDKSTKI